MTFSMSLKIVIQVFVLDIVLSFHAIECSKISLYDLVYKDTWEPTPTETEQWPKEIADGK